MKSCFDIYHVKMRLMALKKRDCVHNSSLSLWEDVHNLSLRYVEDVHKLSLKQRDCPKLVIETLRLSNTSSLQIVSKFQWRVLDSLAVSVTSSGQSHCFSDKLWTSSTYLSDKLWTSSHKLNDELWTQSRFFSAINCKEFEIKA